jgi:regulator of protease activity HflC (stomatin/prohibitin superfamily)
VRSICGQAELDDLLAERESINQKLQLQTLSKIATENNSTTIFPVPIDILRPFYRVDRRRQAAGEGGGTAG